MQNLTVANVLDRAREVHGLKSDYALCKALNCSTQLVANWRHGRSLPDEKSCQALAVLAQFDPYVLIAQMNAQRAKTTEARTIWETIAERLQMAAHGAAAAVFAAVVALGLIAGEADAAGTSAVFGLSAQEVNVYTSYLAGGHLICVILLWALVRFDRGFPLFFVPTK